MCLWIGNIGCDSFFLMCCKSIYAEAREQLTNNLHFLDSLIIKTLLFGDKYTDNLAIWGKIIITIQISAVVHQTNETFYSTVITLHMLNLAILFCVNLYIHCCFLFHRNMTILYCYVIIYWTRYVIINS